MKKGLTELVFILDRSGSMHGLQSDTIGGFNGMLEKQKKKDGEANVTTVLFNDVYEIVHDHFPIGMVQPLTEKDYEAFGFTALLDAVGKTIQKMVNIQRHLPKHARAEKVIFVIMTDGMENSSRKYSYEKVKKMIEKQKEKHGWEFMFLGANMDAVSEAEKVGIGADRSVTFQNDSQGIAINYEVVEDTITQMRTATNMADVDGSWKEEIEKDFAHRGAEKKNHG